MSDNKINVELEEKLLDYHQGLNMDPDKLSDLFDQDKVKEGASLHCLVKEWGGADAIAKGLETDVTDGIDGSQADIKRRREKFGDNLRMPRKIKTIWKLFCENFEDNILKVLIAAAAVSLVLGVINEGWKKGWIEGASIFIAIAIIIVVTTSNNYVKEKQFQDLQAKQDVTSARVIRNGQIVTVDAEELVVGDIITIPAGDNIPADCLAIKTITFTTDESGLTGETLELHKAHVTNENYGDSPDPFLLQNTLAVTGQATAIVCAVGRRTRSGRAERIMNIESEQTPLQAKLETIAELIGKLGFSVALLTFAALVTRMLFEVYIYKQRSITDSQNLTDVLNAFIIAVTVIVVAVPEGLPLAVTISLAFSVAEMSELGNLVRRLHASETMGGAGEICTDKTGTLTQNRMTVQGFYMNDTVAHGNKFKDLKSNPTGDLVAQSVLYNASAYVGNKEDPLTKIMRKTAIGNVTECGLINYLLESGVDCEDLISHRKRPGFMLFDIPFNSGRKRATSVIQLPNGNIRVFCKGAPEIVIEMCESFHGEDGAVMDLSGSKKKNIIEHTVKEFADKCYRTLLVAYLDLTPTQWEDMKSQHNDFNEMEDKEAVECGLTVIGIFALADPLRPGVADAIDTCHRAGITVRMCTGDNIDTATAISLQAHIIKPEDIVDPEERSFVCMTGKEFREQIGGLQSEHDEETNTSKETIKNMKAFRDVEKKLRVLARSQPEDKFMLVTGLKECGRVVAVTGDGNNDAPALNKADVGFSMGIAGTEVCKNASAIVLTNDDFCSVIVAIKYGRNIYDNVRKFLQFQLTVNVAAMFIVFAGAILLSDEALTPVQMLWVNLIMDTLAALALATEPPGDELLLRKPHGRDDKIINSVMWRNILGHGIYQIVVLLVILFEGSTLFKLTDVSAADPFFVTEFWANENQFSDDADLAALANTAISTNTYNWPTGKCTLYTMVFQAFVMMQLFNLLNARKLGDREFNVFSNFFNNFRFLAIFIGIFLIQMAIVEYGGQVVRSATLNTNQNLICIGIGAFSLIWGVIIKIILPSSWFERLAVNEAEMTEEENKHAFVTAIRKSFRESMVKKGSQRGSQNLKQLN